MVLTPYLGKHGQPCPPPLGPPAQLTRFRPARDGMVSRLGRTVGACGPRLGRFELSNSIFASTIYLFIYLLLFLLSPPFPLMGFFYFLRFWLSFITLSSLLYTRGSPPSLRTTYLLTSFFLSTYLNYHSGL